MMLEDLIERELSDSWKAQTVVEDAGDSGIPDTVDEPVAIHESGAELHVTEIESQYIANITQQVEDEHATADVVTDGAMFDDKQNLAGWINHVCDAYDEGDTVIKAFAIIPHNGSIESIASSPLKDADWSTAPEFADVFAVYVNQIPDTVSMEDIEGDREDIVGLVYGNNEALPDSIRELGSRGEAAGSATIDVFTVTGMDLSLTDSQDSEQSQ